MRRRCVCEECGRILRAPIEVRVLFHDCPPRHVPETLGIALHRLPEPKGITLEEKWVEAFSSLFPEDDLLRRVE